MEVSAIALSIPFGVIFLFTGLLINLIQAACYLILWPVSKNMYRRINGIFAEILWLEILGVMEWCSGFEIKLYTDLKTYQLMGEEHALVISNHIFDVDILISWLLAQRSGCLRSALLVLKKTTKYLPIIGWASWFFECVFLNRNWNKDESILKASFQGLKDFYRPFWLTIFVEGTRLTPDKLLDAQKFAASRGFTIPKNVMVPRTKGFVTAVQYFSSFVPAIYDVTIAVPKGHPTPSLLRIFKGKPAMVKVHIKRYSMKELPESDECIAQWCRDRFVAKDTLLDKFQANGTFEEQEIKDFSRTTKSLLVLILGACFVSVNGFIICQRFSLLSTWKGYAFFASILAIVAIVLHIFIQFAMLPPRARVPLGNGQHKQK